MLDFMRRNANSWVMVVLFAVIIFVFAINFGPWAGHVTPSVPYAAVVNDSAISLPEFRTAYASQFARIRQFRPDYDQAQADKDGLKKIVLEQLISRELLYQLGKSNDLTVANKTLAMAIKSRVFGENEPFNKEEYKRRIHGFFQSSIPQFEEQVAKELIADQMNTILGSAIYISDDEVKKDYIERNTKIELEYAKIDPKFFQTNREIPEKEATEFANIQDKAISDYYHENISTFQKEKEVRARHILIKTDASMTEQQKAEKKKKAEEILARLKKGEDFGELARQESEDTGSKTNGGDLGFFNAGMMVDEFSKAAFALAKDQISEIVASPFGYHIIQVTDIKPEQKRTKDEAKLEIAKILIHKSEADKKAHEYADKLLAQFQQRTPLSAITMPSLTHTGVVEGMASSKPEVGKTPMFELGSMFIPRLGRTASVIEASRSLEKAGDTYAKVIDSHGTFYVIRLLSRQDADMAQFAEQEESIRTRMTFPRKRALVQQFVNELRAKAKITYNQSLLDGVEVEG